MFLTMNLTLGHLLLIIRHTKEIIMLIGMDLQHIKLQLQSQVGIINH
jgi:hypothetical protein